MRRHLFFGFLLASSLMSNIGAGAADGKYIGDWYATENESEDGAFLSCAASVTFSNGSLLGFWIYENYALAVGLSQPGWTIPVGSSYPVELSVDGGTVVPSTVEALQTDVVYIPVVEPALFASKMQSGNSLYVKTSTQTLTYPLKGAGAALAEVASCVARRTPGSANPYKNVLSRSTGSAKAISPSKRQTTTSSSTSSSSRSAKDGPNVEAILFTTDLLKRANIGDYRLANKEEIAEKYKGYDVVWETDDVRGSLFDVAGKTSIRAFDVQEFVAQRAEKACDGEVQIDKSAKNIGRGVTVPEIFVSCDGADAVLRDVYAVLSLETGDYYVIGHRSLQRIPAADEAHAAILKALGAGL
jgi:hypothetical protein